MIAKFDLSGVHMTIDDTLQKYVTRKIGRLDKYLPRAHRDSVHAIIELKEALKAKEQKKFTCAVMLKLPQETLNVSETTLNMYAAVDIAEAKLKQQIIKYKDTHANGGKLTRHLTARFRRRTGLSPEQLDPEV